MDEEEFVLVGATLLHDIGKVRQRHELNRTHSELGYEMVRNLTNLPYRERIANLIRYHHSPDGELTSIDVKDRKLLLFLKKADQLSAAHDREDRDSSDQSVREKRLKKVFSLVSRDDGNPSLSKGTEYFPLITLDEYLRDPIKYIDNYKSGLGYENLDSKLVNDINSIHYNEDKNEYLNTLLSVLEKDLSFVPSAYYYSKEDISLYHHQKLAGAIALSLWRSKNSENAPMRMIGGNLSSIQNYIFRHYVSDAADDKATRRMKGRSLIVSLYTDSIISYFLKELDLTWANVIFSKSDGFAIITNEFDGNEIISLRGNVERYLMDLGRDVFVSVSYIDIESTDLDPDSGKEFGVLMSVLQNRINERKNRIMSEYPQNLFQIKRRSVNGLCDYCGHDYGEPDDERHFKCSMCRKEEDFSRWISKNGEDILQTIVQGDSGSIDPDDLVFRYGTTAIVYSLKEGKDGMRILINPKGSNDHVYGRWRSMLLGKSVPLDENNAFAIRPLNDMLCQGDRTFRKCVNLGILKMDMDNMGLILTSRLERKTISVYSSFIYFTQLFFASVVDTLSERNGMYVVYSGGDDLVLMGADMKVIDFAEELHRYFARYFAYDGITVSAGLGVFPARFPIRRGVEITEEELRKSKRENAFGIQKNAVTIAGTTMGWDEFSEMKEKSIQLIYENIENEHIGNNFPYFLMNVQESSIYQPRPLTKKRAYNVPDPMISYYIARNFKAGDQRGRESDMKKNLIVNLTDRNFLEKIKFASFYSILKMRYEEIMGDVKNE